MATYGRCPACRRNHTDGRKHVYKATHQKKVRAIIDKAAAKLSAIIPLHLEQPRVRPPARPGKPPEPNYWCWFCEQDIDNSLNTFFSAATIRHLASLPHHEAVHAFWKSTGAPRNEKEQFLLSETQLELFEESCARAEQLHREEEERRKQEEEEHILSIISGDQHPTPSPSPSFIPTPTYGHTPVTSRAVDFPSSGYDQSAMAHRGLAVIGPQLPPHLAANLPSPAVSIVPRATTTTPTVGVRRTALAFGENLTVITVPELRPGQGNIHTGAKPPWLSDDEHEARSKGVVDLPLTPKEELQRTIQQLEAQRKAAKKAKNPNRVGGWYVEMKRRREALGERQDEGSDWLPSFGGVWNEGPRSHHARKHRALEHQNRPAKSSPYQRTSQGDQQRPSS